MCCCNTEHPLLPFSGENISIMDFLFFKTHLIIIYTCTTPLDVIHDCVYEEETRNEWIPYNDSLKLLYIEFVDLLEIVFWNQITAIHFGRFEIKFVTRSNLDRQQNHNANLWLVYKVIWASAWDL